MKRIAFVAAAALLGTGCISSTTNNPPPAEPGSVNLYWSFVKDAPAQGVGGHIDYDTSYEWPGHANTFCPQSAVDFVTVDSPVGQTTVDCVHANGVQGLGIDGVPAGARTFRFRGWRGDPSTNGVVTYDTTVTLDVHAGMVMDHYVAIPGVWAPLDLFAYLAYGASPGTLYASCSAATPQGSVYVPALTYDVRDYYGQAVAAGSADCNDPRPSYLDQLALDLDDYKVRVRGYDDFSNQVFDSCWWDLQHFDTQTGANGLAPTALTPVPSCLSPFVALP